MSLAEDYNRIIGNAWDGVSRADKRTLTLEHGEQYAVEYWRRHFETATVPWNSVKKTSGNRNSWVRNRQLKINVSDGWEDLNHLFSHYVGRRLGYKPHGSQHIELERDGALLIREKYLPITVALPVVEPKPKRPRRRQESIEDWAERIGCDLDDEYYREYGELYVYPPSQLNNAKMDPFWDDHVAYGRHQARELLAEYERLLTQGAQS
jgi:hypothetical protein